LDIRLWGIKGLSKRPTCIGTERARTHILFYSIPFALLTCNRVWCWGSHPGVTLKFLVVVVVVVVVVVLQRLVANTAERRLIRTLEHHNG
jgi:hypothetical protein